MPQLNEVVTIVNRTQKTLQGTFNGIHKDITPGEHRVTYEQALFYRNQNPIMGRSTPLEDWAMRAEYLIGIKESGDDCSPVEQSSAPQRWDSDLVNGPGRYDVVRSRAPQMSEVKAKQPTADSGGFTKNNA